MPPEASNVVNRGLSEVNHLYIRPDCDSLEVELSFPVWVKANDIDNRELWSRDAEASPEKDSDKGFCPCCNTNVLVLQTEARASSQRQVAHQEAQCL
jgi:hypothetical protein